MDQDILITIGIPVYNAGPFLRNSIKSVLYQTYKKFELIISDDGSTDDSLLIAQSFQDDRIQIIFDGMNRGISYRINQQLSIANGKYFARMDADDLMFPTRIEEQIKIMESNSSVDVIGCQCVVIDDNNRLLGLRTSSFDFKFDTILRSNLFIHPTVFGKTKWFKENPYNEDFNGIEDYDLWINTFNKSKFYVYDEALLFYRDPLTLKLQTYLSRHLQIRKAYRKYLRKSLISYKIYFKLILISYLKSDCYYVFSKLGLASIFIKRRNKPLNLKKLNYFSSILEGIINN